MLRGTLYVLLLVMCLTTHAQTFELLGKDTVNRTDKLGKKQGHWIIRGKDRPGKCYRPDQTVAIGDFQDNRRVGVWIEYYCSGKVKTRITFLNGRPEGYAWMYHENGKIHEEGLWKNSRWIGAYKLYYPNGQVQHEFLYSANGKREGAQRYYYENGQLAVEGSFVNGKEAGLFKEYHENGELKSTREYNEGAVNETTVREFPATKPLPKREEVATAPPIKVAPDEQPNEAMVDKGIKVLNGRYTLYNKNRQVAKEGLFKDNLLIEGKVYIYDSNGILQRIAVYKSARYIGDSPLEN